MPSSPSPSPVGSSLTHLNLFQDLHRCYDVGWGKTPSLFFYGGCELLPLRHNCDNTCGCRHGLGGNNYKVKSLCIFRVLVIRIFKTIGLIINPTIYTIYSIYCYIQMDRIFNGSDQCMHILSDINGYFYKQTE